MSEVAIVSDFTDFTDEEMLLTCLFQVFSPLTEDE
jgi:hypothetical protein